MRIWPASRGVLLSLVAFATGCGAPNASQPVAFSIVAFDWANPRNLTNHEYWDFDPAYSPDGTLIAFHSNRPPSPNNRGQIYVMNADGSEPRALTHTEGTNYGAAWSPDGRKIAFASERDGDPEIYVMNADGTEQINLTNNPDAYDSGPDWSPDGNYIAYFSGTRKPEDGQPVAPGSPYRYWNAELFILDVRTGEKTQLTFSDHDDIYPVWSHDGTKLAFTSSRDGNNEIYTMNVDGTDVRRITNNQKQDNAAAWLPGDRFLSFNDGEEVNGEFVANVHVADLQTGEILRVTDRPGVIYFNGDVSPDGERIVYAAFTQDPSAFRGERADIYLIERR